MKRIALLGMPNTGKSTFFNRITGASARVGNWPGITVDLMGAKVLLGADMVELVDLPGIYDLHGFSDDEQVVRHFLENNPVDLVLVIINTSQIERQLSIALQIKQLNLPALMLLNMSDEAEKFGITVDLPKLSEMLGMPVALISAKYGNGYKEAHQTITQTLRESQPVPPQRLHELLSQDSEIEATLNEVVKTAVQIPVQLSDKLTTRFALWF